MVPVGNGNHFITRCVNCFGHYDRKQLLQCLHCGIFSIYSLFCLVLSIKIWLTVQFLYSTVTHIIKYVIRNGNIGEVMYTLDRSG